MAIPVVDARNLFTKKLIAVYKERTAPTSFLRSFFKVVESGAKELSIEVQRGTEKIAVDVERGTEGNRNSFSRSTEKIFVPPYYREFFDATELDLYDRLFAASGSIEEAALADFINGVADKLRMLQDKIERAYEVQCSQVLETGIVTLNAGINIDFKRKADSLVNGAASTWVTGTNNPFDHIKSGCEFLRKVGKVQGDVFNVIMGSSAKTAFDNNDIVIKTANLRRVDHLNIRMPQRQSVGGTTHGEFAAGDYTVRVWTYPEFYDNAAGVSTPYINPKKIVILPEAPNFKLGFAAVPQLITNGITRTKGAYVVGDYVDERNASHIFDIKSAGVAIPVAVDQIYTRQVVA